MWETTVWTSKLRTFLTARTAKHQSRWPEVAACLLTLEAAKYRLDIFQNGFGVAVLVGGKEPPWKP